MPYESGNNNLRTNANTMLYTDIMYGTISGSNDVDCYKVTFPYNGTATFRCVVPKDVNYRMKIFDGVESSAECVASDTNTQTGEPRIAQCTINKTKTYYIVISPQNDGPTNATSYYTLSINFIRETYTCNYANKILVQTQRFNPGNCAGTCAAMCVKKTYTEVEEDGYSTYPVSFETIANAYGYNCSDSDVSSSFTASTLLTKLKQGNPVIAKIRDKTINGTESDHWVVVTGFSGYEDAPTYDMFTCADPAYGDLRNLEDSNDFRGFYRSVIFSPRN